MTSFDRWRDGSKPVTVRSHRRRLARDRFSSGTILARYLVRGVLIGACLWAVQPALASDLPVIPARSTTRHQFASSGKQFTYDAIFDEQVLSDRGGRPQATISATSYLRANIARPMTRPVIFAFNGGPGASSSPLHFEAFGPRQRVKAADGSQRIVDNSDSLLPYADLVFIDPVGTGFSRVLPGGSGVPYWSVPGDASSVLGYIRYWLRSHHRERSPIIIAGESYGGTRAARICADADDLNLTGLILISPSFDADPAEDEKVPSDAEAVALLPAMAVAAAKNGVADPGIPLADVFDNASAFALGDYAEALARQHVLSAADRAAVAQRVSRLIGFPTQKILDADLKVDPEAYRKEVLANRGLVMGRLDTRVTSPIPVSVPKRPSAANDPALGLGSSNVILSDTIARYLHGDLDVPGSQNYVSLTLDVNFAWNWKASQSDPKSMHLAADVAGIMRRKPAMRTVLIGGYYDMAVPLLGPIKQLTDAGVPMDRLIALKLWEGHSVLASPEQRSKMVSMFRPLLNP